MSLDILYVVNFAAIYHRRGEGKQRSEPGSKVIPWSVIALLSSLGGGVLLFWLFLCYSGSFLLPRFLFAISLLGPYFTLLCTFSQSPCFYTFFGFSWYLFRFGTPSLFVRSLSLCLLSSRNVSLSLILPRPRSPADECGRRSHVCSDEGGVHGYIVSR